MRLDKFLSNLKYGTRKELRKVAAQGRIFVNGIQTKDLSTNINEETDQIEIDKELVFYKKDITLMVYKPKGILSSNSDTLHPVVTSLLKSPYDRFDFNIAGRLDLDASGLLILTTSGELTHQIISPNHEVYKTYEVVVNQDLIDISPLLNGIEIRDGKNEIYQTKPAKIVKLSDLHYQIQIAEGKFHQVKRMFEAMGVNVLELKRTAIGELMLDKNLQPGEYIELEEVNVASIFKENMI